MGQVARKFELVEGGCFEPANEATKQPAKQPLNNPDPWVTSADIETLAGLSQQAVNKALRSRRWRGADLMVREEASNVGRGGKVLRVHVDSLPADLREAWYLARGITLHERVDPVTGETRLVADDSFSHDPNWAARSAVASWKMDIIRPAIAHEKGTAARKAAIEALAGQVWTDPAGKRKPVSKSSLYAWVAAHDADGIAGLLPALRKDRGTKKVIVSQSWDEFFSGRIEAARHEAVRDQLVQHIRSLWASGESGWRAIAEKSTTRLIEISRELRDVGFDALPIGRMSGTAGDDSQFAVCWVNRRIVAREEDYRLIAVRNKDNAVYQDRIAATVRRDYSLLKPREIVVGDVHPTDIMVLRPDGSKAYPKAISWFDPATNEIHMTIVLLEPGEGIRREHVAMSFAAMVADWGLPKLLYLDNGSEYRWAEMIDGFTQLSKLASLSVKEFGEGSIVDQRVLEARQAVVRSLAYNAKGKPGIEGAFGNLERVFFSNLLGWTAGDRMRKKTHAKGRDPVPFDGDMTEFMRQIGTALDWYHKRPQHGRLDGRSPNEALRDHVDAGWGKVVLADPRVLALAFSTVETRVVDRGSVAFKPRHDRSQRYYCKALLERPGERITIRVPAYDPQFLFCFAEDGELIGIARPEQQFHPLDVTGAVEAQSRNKYLRRHITQMSRHCALLDLVEETARHVGHLPDAPDVPVAATVDAGMFDRMVQREAEERAALATPDRPRTRAPRQWGAGQNAALAAVTFDEEGEEG